MKRKKLIIFTIIIFFALSTNVNAYELNSYQSEVLDNEISAELMDFLELTPQNILSLSQSELETIKNIDFNNSKKDYYYYEDTYIYENFQEYLNKNVPISISSKKISKLEYDNSIQRKGLVSNNLTTRAASSSNYYETNAKKITLTISQLTTNIKEKYVVSSLNWKTMPSVRSHDVYGMRITNGYFIKNTQNGVYNFEGYTYDNGCSGLIPLRETVNISSGWNKANINTILHGVSHTGIGYTVKLRTNGVCYDNDAAIPLYENVTGMNLRISCNAYSTASSNQITVNSSYQHATSSVAYNNVVSSYAFSASGLGSVINFTNGYNSKYDGMGGVSLTN